MTRYGHQKRIPGRLNRLLREHIIERYEIAGRRLKKIFYKRRNYSYKIFNSFPYETFVAWLVETVKKNSHNWKKNKKHRQFFGWLKGLSSNWTFFKADVLTKRACSVCYAYNDLVRYSKKINNDSTSRR